MWRVVVVLLALSTAGQTELRLPPPVLQLPIWADPQPREVTSGLIVDRIDYENCDIKETLFSDTTLAAILSNTLPGG